MSAISGAVLLSGPYPEHLPVMLAPVVIAVIVAIVADARYNARREARNGRAPAPREQEEELRGVRATEERTDSQPERGD